MEKMKQRLYSEEQCIGAMISEVPIPNIAKIYKTGGLDFAIIDCEHGAFDFSQVAGIVAVANAVGLPVIVRIPSNSREVVLKTLELGADGLLLPMTNSAEIISQVVEHGKYPPIGKRGFAGNRPHSGYKISDVQAYLWEANERTMIFGQIETKESVENCAEIMAVEGVDGVFIGPNDLSVDLGVPGDVENPLVFDALEKVMAAASRIQKPVGVITSNDPLVRFSMNKGIRLFSIGSETGMILKSVEKIVHQYSK